MSPLPASYTESTLSALMEAELGAVGVALGIGDSDALPEAVNEVIGILGHALSQETTTAGLMKVRAIARWQAWQAAFNAATNDKDLKAGTTAITMSQRFDHIQRRLAQAEAAASRYSEVQAVLAGSMAVITSIVDAGPYGVAALTEFG